MHLGLEAIHWFEPSQWAKMAHEGRFLYSRYHKWPSRTPHNYDRHKHMRLYSCSYFHTSNSFMLVINKFLLGRFIEMYHMKPSLVHDFFTSNQLKWFHFINPRRSFLMPNIKNAKIKSRKFSITSRRRHFFNTCIR